MQSPVILSRCYNPPLIVEEIEAQRGNTVSYITQPVSHCPVVAPTKRFIGLKTKPWGGSPLALVPLGSVLRACQKQRTSQENTVDRFVKIIAHISLTVF